MRNRVSKQNMLFIFQLKIILHTKNKEVVKVMKKDNQQMPEMTEMSEFSDDVKVVITKMVQQTIMNTLGKKQSKELPNGEFRTDKYNN